MGSSWWYGQDIDELKGMIPQTILQSKTPRNNAIDDDRRYGENRKDFLNFLACERQYEARDQLQNLGNTLMPLTPDKTCLLHPCIEQESPMHPKEGNTCTILTGSVSKICNNQFCGSSPMNLVLDMVPSPVLSDINMYNSCMFGVQSVATDEYTCSKSMEIDMASIIIDSFVKGKTLPEKGKLFQAVIRAGPLLETLIQEGFTERCNPPSLPVVGCHTDHIDNGLTLTIPQVSNGSNKLCSKPPFIGRRTRQNKGKGLSSMDGETPHKRRRRQ